MSKQVSLITGAGRGMGADFARAALAAGHAVVATGRNSEAVFKALGPSNDLLVVTLDVTSLADAEAAVKTAVDRFGRIDVLEPISQMPKRHGETPVYQPSYSTAWT